MSDSSDQAAPQTFTGRARRRKTRTSVKVVDAVAKYGITIGGLGVVAALAAIIAFLVSVVVPLFYDADVDRGLAADLPAVAMEPGREPVAMALDENLKGLWTLDAAGQLTLYKTDPPDDPAPDDDSTGDGGAGALTKVSQRQLSDVPVTAVSESRGTVGLGRADGTIVVGRIDFELDYLRDRPAELTTLGPGDRQLFDGGIADLTPRGQVRVTRLAPSLSDAVPLEGEAGPREAAASTRPDETPATNPADFPPGLAVTAIDYVADAGSEVMLARRADGRTFWAGIETKEDLRTGEKTVDLRKYELPPSQQHDPDAPVSGVFLGRNGTSAYVLFDDGHLVWYDTKDLARGPRGGEEPTARIAQELQVTPGGESVSHAAMLLGDYTLIVGDTAGGLAGWFPSPAAYDELDDWTLKRAHQLADQPAPLTSIAVSGRDRQFLSGDALGNLWLRHMTSDTTQAKLDLPGEGAGVRVAAIAPMLNAVAAIGTDGSLATWRMKNPHADGKLPALFTPVHYEGRAGGEFVWQSSAAGDEAEPKLSLIPLIWGTLKATAYAMIFATPIAILAAIYSSEFMQPRVRSVVKPSIELMAGLPSVVLGFVAARVLAPYVEDVLPGMLLVFAAVPVGVMVFGFLWQLVPPDRANRQAGFWALGGLGAVLLGLLLYYGGLPPIWAVVGFAVVALVIGAVVLVKGEEAGPFMPFVVMAELVVASLLLGLAAGPLFESLLFGGDLRGWLRGAPSGWVADLPATLQGVPGWVLLLTPLATVALVIIFNLYVRQSLPLFDGRGRTRTQMAAIDLGRFAVVGGLGLLLAAGLGLLLSVIGLDLRDDALGEITGGVVQSNGLLDGFIQLNSLNLGIVMGFAIIPIIYTVSEDALTAVPNTLRSASLGAGATPWQTAVRVVLPVAVSGIFSACMIGLGRAVGETMIVLMAAGNTATMNLNIFDGMRTLSANIATEMPEAPKGGTLYRVLFFSALVLFAMTFVVNTLAELIRIRFRKRAFQL